MKSCDAVPPEDLDVSGLTHVIFSFAFFDPSTFQITPMDANAGTLLSRFTALKRRKPRLETWIAIGGWSFNDPGNVPNKESTNEFIDCEDYPGLQAISIDDYAIPRDVEEAPALL